MNELDSLSETLEDEILCTLSTVADDGSPYLCTIYFAACGPGRLIFLSEPDATHVQQLLRRPSAAVALADSRQAFGSPHHGASLIGTAQPVVGDAARETAFEPYANKFPVVLEWLQGRSLDDFEYCVFEFVADHGTVVDGRFDGSEKRAINFMEALQ